MCHSHIFIHQLIIIIKMSRNIRTTLAIVVINWLNIKLLNTYVYIYKVLIGHP